MSIRLVAQVWEYHFTHAEQSVMLALADHAHDDGTHCFPSIPYLAWKTEYSERQVQRVMRDLADHGVIVPVAHWKGGRGHAVEYLIRLEKGVKKSPFREKGDMAGGKGDMADGKGDMAMAPEPSEESMKQGGVSSNLARTREWSKRHPLKGKGRG